jgi:prepilin-type N-terminal cleavage/methylation domain-containing protein
MRNDERTPFSLEPAVVNGPEGGFTLIEIVVVLVLLGALLGLALSKTGLNAGLPSTSRQLIGAMRDAVSTASVTQRIHRLNLDLNQGSYWITEVTPDGERPPANPLLAQPVVLPSHITLQDVSTWQQGRVSTGRAFIQFFPTGRAEPAVIHLADADQNVTTLRLNPLTGHVQALDHYVEPPGLEPIPERLRPWFLPDFVQPPGSASPGGGPR